MFNDAAKPPNLLNRPRSKLFFTIPRLRELR